MILVLLACGSLSVELPEREQRTDVDGDGWTVADGDCDDRDRSVYPGAPEYCDEADDDCDRLVDGDDPDVVGGWAVWRDADGDGFGGDEASHACSVEEGWVEVAGDCDDRDRSVHPGAAEYCDEADDDCDGLVDADDPDVQGAATWYRDADGDGAGDDASTRVSCTAEAGWALVGGDCDDDDPAVIACEDTGGGDSGGAGSGKYVLIDLRDAVNRDHTDGPWTDDPSESFDVSPGVHEWTVADGATVPFEIIDPDGNAGASLICTRGGEDWRPSYGFPEVFEIAGLGAHGARVHVAGLASGWSDPSLFEGVAATLTVEFTDGTSQVIELANGTNLDDWNHTWHEVSSPDAVKVYEDVTYGRHIDALTVALDSRATIGQFVLRDDASVHTGTAAKTSVEIFAITVEE